MKFLKLTIAASIALAFAMPAMAQTADSFYKGKRITVVVGSAAGSGYDAYARLLARHMTGRMQGSPAVVVQNMPGGGGLTSANHLYNVSLRDGTVIGSVQRGLLISPLIMPDGVKYDVTKFHWLGSTNAETGVVAVWHTAPHKTIADVMQNELVVGGSGPYTDSETTPRAYNRILGTKFRIVSGYESTSPVLLAMERGEVQGIGNSSWSNWTTTYAHYLRDKTVRLLLQSGPDRNPDLPDVPMALDLAKTEADRQALELLLAPNQIGRPFVAPPEVPSDRVNALRVAFDATVADKTLLQEAKAQNMDISPVTGQYIEQTVARLYALPVSVVRTASEAIQPDRK
jgi:tripartite-type tricarboxylate transporter receptor subunit TctC